MKDKGSRKEVEGLPDSRLDGVRAEAEVREDAGLGQAGP